MRITLLTLSVACVIVISGCHTRYTLQSPPTPPVLKGAKNEQQALRDQLATLREDEESDAGLSKRDRDLFIYRVVATIDGGYVEYVQRLESTRDTLSFVSETTSTTLSAVSAILGGVDTKSILSTASALVGSSQVSFDKNFFQKQTTNALITEMDALRLTTLNDIKNNTKKNTDDYSLEEAIVDLKAYLAAGTLPKALRALEGQSALQLNQAQKSTQQSITLSSTAITFPAAAAGGTRVLPLTITNSGSASLNITNVSVDSAVFQVDSGACTNLNPGQDCVLQITFIPPAGAAGQISKGTLTVNYNASDSPKTVSLQGTTP
jgi:hypothetical protein